MERPELHLIFGLELNYNPLLQQPILITASKLDLDLDLNTDLKPVLPGFQTTYSVTRILWGPMNWVLQKNTLRIFVEGRPTIYRVEIECFIVAVMSVIVCGVNTRGDLTSNLIAAFPAGHGSRHVPVSLSRIQPPL